uniref:Uncharacterized protein n=1 Tax=Timema cristinae TaxID=61476 RepID=A0A7R9GXW3_TIMCR|nr:unnamed protein product [Timema cristinae]
MLIIRVPAVTWTEMKSTNICREEE